MRVLVTTPGGLGHVHPMVPLARAISARGHQVLWALPQRSVGVAEKAGIQAVAAGPKQPVYPADVMRAFPELAELSPTQRPTVMFGKLFGALTAPPFLADLAPLASEWRPNLIVADAAELSAHIVAAELGIPSVTKGFGALLPADRMALAAEEVAPLWRDRGLEPRPFAGCYDHLYLDIYPPEMQSERADHVPRREMLRPVADAGSLDPSAEVPLPAGRRNAPLIYVTMGTVFNDPAPLRVVLEALEAVDARALVTVGPAADPTALGPQPAHIRIEPYVPQSAVLPLCQAVISHAGSGTVLATLGEGVPQLCLPQGADQFLNAAAVASSGAGRQLLPHEADPDTVRRAISTILEDPSYREAAERVSASIASMPSPDDVAALLETLV